MSEATVHESSQPRLLAPRRLLIVQRNAFAARSMQRYLAAHFDSVQLAEAGEQVAALLSDGSYSPTHLICGEDLGPYSECGSSLIPHWRALCPSLVCVVLATGALDLPRDLPGVDAVLQKPSEASRILALLAA